MNRRAFLRATGMGMAGMVVGCASAGSRGTSPLAKGKPLGANEDIRVAVIGLHKQGHFHIRQYASMRGVRIVALCDADQRVLEERESELARGNMPVRSYRDVRELLDSKDIDAVSIAMPNHWHALATVWACQAGKHVLVEKPVSHCIWEGRKMVEAARKYRRMVQAGQNHRSRPGVAQAFDYVESGGLGKIVCAYAWDYKRRESMGKIAGVQRIPQHIDYNLWTGPAPMLPLMRKELHYDWHWQWATGNGEIGNNGIHWLDCVRWALRKDDLPRTVMAFGGRWGYVDDGETPNTHTAVYDYDGIPVVYEARGLARGKSPDATMDDFEFDTVTGKAIRIPPGSASVNGGFAIVCEGGYCHQNGVYDNDGKVIKEFTDERSTPQKSFIAALRSENQSDLRGEIRDASVSANICHMGNIPILCGEAMAFDAALKQLTENRYAARSMKRMIAHLGANGIDAAQTSVIVGPTLAMDSATERFTGEQSKLANLFVRNDYREPFVVRERV